MANVIEGIRQSKHPSFPDTKRPRLSGLFVSGTIHLHRFAIMALSRFLSSVKLDSSILAGSCAGKISKFHDIFNPVDDPHDVTFDPQDTWLGGRDCLVFLPVKTLIS